MTAEVVKQAAAGERAAFAQIVTQYRGLVFALCLARTGDRDDAEDLTQDVFVTVYRHLSTLKEPGKFLSWLRRISVNRCNLWARERQATISLDEAPDEPHEEVPPVHAKQQAQIAVTDALKAVSENNRVVLTLHYASGYSYKEIADLLELPVATVRSRLREGRQQMKRELLKVIKELLQMRLSSSELAEQVIARCHGKTCACAQELLNP